MTSHPTGPSALNQRHWIFVLLALFVLSTGSFYALLFFAPDLHQVLFFVGAVPLVLALVFAWVAVKNRTLVLRHTGPMRLFTFVLLALQLLTMFVRLYYEPAENTPDIRGAVMMLFMGLTAGVGAALVLRSERL